MILLQDPKMQQLLYPYLPEGMRNPQTFEWMMSNPEYRAQLEEMLNKQVSSSWTPCFLLFCRQLFNQCRLYCLTRSAATSLFTYSHASFCIMWSSMMTLYFI